MSSALPYVRLPRGQTVAQVSIAADNTCALFNSGSLSCWGHNDLGQLGYGDTITRGASPNTMGDVLPFVPLGTGRTVDDVSAGQGGQFCAVLDNHAVKCWGKGGAALGYGDSTLRGSTLTQMGDNLPAVNLGTGRGATAVTVGSTHTCAVLDDQNIKCWGQNGNGQLGYGDTLARGALANQMGDNLPEVPLGTGRTALSVFAAFNNTCALLDNHQIKCWGVNTAGELGTGDPNQRGALPGEMGDNLPAIALPTGRTAVSMSFADAHACAVLDTNQVVCWGNNSYGSLGYGDSNNRGSTAASMGSNLPFVAFNGGQSVQQMFLLDTATCALLSNGLIQCWAYNGNGQLGLGDTLPRQVAPSALPTVSLW